MSLSSRPIPEIKITLAEIEKEISKELDAANKNATGLYSIYLKAVEVSQSIKKISGQEDIITEAINDHQKKNMSTLEFLKKVQEPLRVISYSIQNEKNNLSLLQKKLQYFDKNTDMINSIAKTRQILEGLISNLKIVVETFGIQQNIATKIKDDALAAQNKIKQAANAHLKV